MSKSTTAIAVVDDESAVRAALLRLLRAAGMEALAFSSGPEFLDILRTRRFDCVILDLQLHSMTAYEIQTDSGFIAAGIPTIIITAHNEPGTRDKCLALGAIAYLCKPFDDKVLLDAIHEAIRKRS